MKTFEESKTVNDFKMFNNRTLFARMRSNDLGKKEKEAITQVIEQRVGKIAEEPKKSVSDDAIRAKIDEVITDFLSSHKREIIETVVSEMSSLDTVAPLERKRKKRVPATKLSESKVVKGMKIGSQVSFKVGHTSKKRGGRRFKGFVFSIREKEGVELTKVLTEEGYFDKKSSDVKLIN